MDNKEIEELKKLRKKFIEEIRLANKNSNQLAGYLLAKETMLVEINTKLNTQGNSG